jgi:beta-1,2-mannobiose phosphorylase / 1,2-beta-oligomannan phosphorylase
MYDDTTDNKGNLISLLTRIRRVVTKKDILRGLGVYTDNKQIYFYYQSKHADERLFHIAASENGFDFDLHTRDTSIIGLEDKISKISDFQISKVRREYVALFKKRLGSKTSLAYATSLDLIKWRYKSECSNIFEVGVVVPHFKYKGQYVMYYGEEVVKIAYSTNMKDWKPANKIVMEPRKDKFDFSPLEVEHVLLTNAGILVLYHSKEKSFLHTHFKVGAALFDKNDPSRVLWRSDSSIWEERSAWECKKVFPVGAVEFKGKLISYWGVEHEGIYAVVYSIKGLQVCTTEQNIVPLAKHIDNPILAPNGENEWEAFNTFNPAAVYAGGKVHIIYRAQGYDYVSMIGYAASKDGIHIDERLDEPVYKPSQPFEFTPNVNVGGQTFMSGGGYGGCEDPRVTLIDNKVYMTYVAYDGWRPPRIALTSIDVDDFLNHRWFWEKPVLISPPNIVDKSGCIFPEKVNGKYVVLHRIFPNILLDYVDDLNFDGSTWLKGEYSIKIREDMWDSRKIGAGAPPIKTKDGWLLIYYAVDDKDAGRYKIGAMLLDLNDPTKVLHRSNQPILEPTHRYENEGFKPGIAYPCGAVAIRGILYVYYGGADSVVCVATANLDTFLQGLKSTETASLEPAIIRKVSYPC